MACAVGRTATSPARTLTSRPPGPPRISLARGREGEVILQCPVLDGPSFHRVLGVTMAGGFAGLKSVGFAPSTVMKNFELGLSSENFSWLFGVREGGELIARSSAVLI